MTGAGATGQTWTSALVDTAVLLVVVVLALREIKEPAVWALLSTIVGVRFGVGVGKTVERVSARRESTSAPTEPPPPTTE